MKIDNFEPIYPEIFQSFTEKNYLSELSELTIIGSEQLPSYFHVSSLASESVGMAGLALSYLIKNINKADTLHSIEVNQRLASLWFKRTIRPIGWELPSIWNEITGDYQCKDGWIRIHANAPKHRQAALSVLNVNASKDSLNNAVKHWQREDLVDAIILANGCASTMYDTKQWLDHPQGKAVTHEPLIHWHTSPIPHITRDHFKTFNPLRPLQGVRVLDLTRILAGPISTRFLAAYGADVLRIDPPDWEEPGNAPEVTLGKRCAGLNLHLTRDRKTFEKLIKGADILVHGYRPGALASLGYSGDQFRRINPQLINISLNAYGWTGPWSERRGFDSLIQMNSGIAALSMQRKKSDHPVPLPAQALDHSTGYLMAAAAIHSLHLKQQNIICSARLSLARTAHLLQSQQPQPISRRPIVERAEDINTSLENTSWGKAHRIRFPLNIENTSANWHLPASKLRSSDPKWL